MLLLAHSWDAFPNVHIIVVFLVRNKRDAGACLHTDTFSATATQIALTLLHGCEICTQKQNLYSVNSRLFCVPNKIEE